MLFRNRRFARPVACYLLLQMVSTLLFPSVSLAMMGPSQPEFTSYEAPGATDLVNLSTGDFSYSIPVLDIPGPERSFSLPLTYKAGIQLEQEASWVGLGWSLNPGAIARSVNGYADDAAGEPVENTFNKQISRGWTGGLPGVLDLGWNSISGHSGAASLLGLFGTGWNDKGIDNVNLAGVNYSAGQGVSVNPVQMAQAALTIASLGVGSSSLSSVASNVGAQVLNGAIISSAATGRLGGVAGFNNQPTREVTNHAWSQDYWNYYNNNTTETAYGSLYFGAMSQNVFTGPSNNSGFYNASQGPDIYPGSPSATPSKAPLFRFTRAFGKTGNTTNETAADVYQDDTDEDAVSGMTGKYRYTLEGTQYRSTSQRPISIAHDYFSVMGEGVSGAIRPYRLEVGSIAYPKLGANANQLGEVGHYKHMVVPFLNDYKVGFRYENSLSNGYTFHQYTPQGNQPVGFNLNADYKSLTITDPSLYSINPRTETSRRGLYNEATATAQRNRQLVQGKHVSWFTNEEIAAKYDASADGADDGFLEFEHPATSSAYYGSLFRKYYVPRTGIGAFAVTAEDGTTYHYSLPVYQHRTYTESNEVQTSSTIGGLGKSTRRPKPNLAGGNGLDSPEGTYATAWLLTAITSSDYIDRNHNGVVDASDWGGWVKFAYGKFSSRYKWRQPYIGNSYSDDSTVIQNVGFTEGYKQTYYLNSIATRSHTALFVKSVRQDGRGHFQANGASNLRIDETKPASSLRLDEIILLDNATLAKLQTSNGIAENIPALTNATGGQFGPFADGPMSGAGDDLDAVLDEHDLDGDNRIRAFVEANAIKRLHFNYSYDLCPGTPSSFACVSTDPSSLPLMDEAHMSTNRSGKLTLKSVSFFGPTVNNTPTKITPDFTFGYDKASQTTSLTNPSYGKEKWDAFGMYAPAGAYEVASHKPQRDPYPAPWTLTSITSPLGGVTEITYERDEYAHVSEYGAAKVHLSRVGYSSVYNVTNKSPFAGNLTAALKVGQTLYLNGLVRYGSRGYAGSGSYSPVGYQGYVHIPVQVAAVTNSQVTIEYNFAPPRTRPGDDPYVVGYGEFDTVVPNNLVGGDIRVAAITTKDGTAAYQVRYKYTNPTASADESALNSSGVLAKEPPFLDRFYHPINTAFDYPATPVIYGQVTVLRGLFRNNAEDDYETREVYSFFTPSSTMLTETAPLWQALNPKANVWVADNRTTVDVGKIAQPQKIEIYNHRGEQELATSFTYASTVANAQAMASQGHYTEGVLNNEQILYRVLNSSEYRINRSTKEYVPAVMVGSRNTRNGITTASSNVLYDFYTGQVVETAFTNSLGKIYHSRIIPAYTLVENAGMGAKGDGAANRHMLAQVGASYTYMEVPGGATYNPLNPLDPQTSRILSASVQTWQPTWANYREADTNGNYQDVAGQTPVWRPAATYVWRSPFLAPDGSFKDFVPFVWTGTPNAHWLKAGETVRYDHYSHGLESRDVNGSYATQKTGYDQTQLIASATNARYTELAYSGAEDQLMLGGTTQFGGEVVAGGVADNSIAAHTGFYSNQLAANQAGFLYRAQAGRDIDVGKTYRVSAWVHANAPGGQLYATYNGTRLAEVARSSSSTKKAGSWYLLTLLVTIPPAAVGQVVEFGCLNTGVAAGNFDDFRVAPLTATVTSKVYDPRTNNLLYSLDNDNLFTHYEYTPTGRLKKVYQETLDGTGSNASAEKLVKEYDFNYAR